MSYSSVQYEVSSYLESWNIRFSNEAAVKVVREWIENLSSHCGADAHRTLEYLGVADETGMDWDEQDAWAREKIARYEDYLCDLCSAKETKKGGKTWQTICI